MLPVNKEALFLPALKSIFRLSVEKACEKAARGIGFHHSFGEGSGIVNVSGADCGDSNLFKSGHVAHPVIIVKPDDVAKFISVPRFIYCLYEL